MRPPRRHPLERSPPAFQFVTMALIHTPGTRPLAQVSANARSAELSPTTRESRLAVERDRVRLDCVCCDGSIGLVVAGSRAPP